MIKWKIEFSIIAKIQLAIHVGKEKIDMTTHSFILLNQALQK